VAVAYLNRTLRKARLAALVAIASCAFAGCAAHAQRHWLRIADGAGDLPSLNPHLTAVATMDDLGQLSLAYFMRYDREGKLRPELITEVPSLRNGGVSRDGLRLTWHLRRGVRWSDGAPFDARDVAFTIRAILNPANNEIGGTEGWDMIRHVDTPDPYTVVYVLRRPYGALVPMSFTPVGGGPCVLPYHILGRLPNINTAPYNAKPVGIGPFRIVAWKRGDSIEMEPNPYYWRGQPKLRHVTYKLIGSRDTTLAQLRNGEIDLWPGVPPTYVPQVRALRGIRSDSEPNLRTTHLDFMLAPGSVADRAVREAVRLSIDRPLLVRTVEHGSGLLTDAIVWPENPVHRNDPHAISPDPMRARRLLTRDGWRLGPAGVRIKGTRTLALVVVYQSGAPDLDSLIELIRAELRAAGIELVTRKYTHDILFAPQAEGGILASGRFDAALYASTLVSLPDLASNFDCAQAPPHGENYNRWCDPRVNALLRTMRGSYDPVVVHKAFGQLDRLFIDQIPSIQLFVWKGSYALSDRLTGYQPNALTAFDDMLDVDI